MCDVTDLIVPLLQRMQGNLSEIKRTLAQHGEILEAHSQTFEELEIDTVYETGLGSQNKADLQVIKTMEQRLSTIETVR